MTENSGPSNEFGELFKSQLAALTAEQATALQEYRDLRDSGRLAQARIASYRCADGCQLADVFQTPAGAAVYRLQAGPDGTRETASLLSEFAGFDAIGATCDHLDTVQINPDQVQWEVLNRDPGGPNPDILVVT